MQPLRMRHQTVFLLVLPWKCVRGPGHGPSLSLPDLSSCPHFVYMTIVIMNVLNDVWSAWSGFGFRRHTLLVCSVLFCGLCESSLQLNMFASHWGAASGQSVSSAVLRLSTDGTDAVFAWSIISIAISPLSGGISYGVCFWSIGVRNAKDVPYDFDSIERRVFGDIVPFAVEEGIAICRLGSLSLGAMLNEC